MGSPQSSKYSGSEGPCTALPEPNHPALHPTPTPPKSTAAARTRSTSPEEYQALCLSLSSQLMANLLSTWPKTVFFRCCIHQQSASQCPNTHQLSCNSVVFVFGCWESPFLCRPLFPAGLNIAWSLSKCPIHGFLGGTERCGAPQRLWCGAGSLSSPLCGEFSQQVGCGRNSFASWEDLTELPPTHLVAYRMDSERICVYFPEIELWHNAYFLKQNFPLRLCRAPRGCADQPSSPRAESP